MAVGRAGRWRLAAVLGVACLALGSVLFWQLDRPVPGGAGKAPAQSADHLGDEDEAANDAAASDSADAGDSKATDDDVFRLPPLTEFSDIVERPLFTRGRRPAPPSADDAGAVANADGSSPFLLSGVIIAGARRVALLQTRNSPKTIRVEEGETIQGWKVVAIRPHVVTISSGSNKDELKLPDRIGAPPSSPPPRQSPRAQGAIPNDARGEGVPPPFMPPGHPTEQAPDGNMGQE